MTKQHETIINWEAPEFKHYQKNTAWYITLVIIVALLITYQVIESDYFGAISLAVVAGFIIFFARHKPKIIPVEISDQGIHINETLIPYSRIKHFWVIDSDAHKTLNIETTAYLNHILTIELGDQDADLVRDVLIELLPEHTETEPTVSQRIAHRFWF